MSSYNQQSKIRGALRQVARYMPQKNIALELAKNHTIKGVRGGSMYDCAICKKPFPLKDVQVDHIEPVVPIDREIKDWNEYIQRLFCGVENLQVLCKDHHKQKTLIENEARRANGIRPD